MDWIAHATRARFLAKRDDALSAFLLCHARLADWANGDESGTPFGIGPEERAKAVFQRLQDWTNARQEPKVPAPAANLCPCCGSRPTVAALRAGGVHSLICAACTYEWPFPQGACPHCDGELTVHLDEELPHLRVECCVTCKHYLICADLVKDPEAIPLVDDVAGLPLHLWAIDHGYTKIEPNLYGF